ncbi:MAG TPA: PEP-CTERM sorting domain-containing protein [Chthoniobacteraceae bacterium]|nr:PEP-CTERM sorting domain-containing protein [Chthoniobacteraceae bacterium]
MKTPLRILLAFSTLVPLLSASSQAAATWGSASAADLNWSTPGNWSGELPEGSDVIFGNNRKTDQGVASNVVDQSFGVRSLTYNLTGLAAEANWHVTEISENVTLTVSGLTGGDILDVGTTSSGSSSPTFAAVQGDGRLRINQADANIRIGSRLAAGATLDLSGLAEFEASVAEISIGFARNSSASTYVGALWLADVNHLKADRLYIGQTANGSTQVINGTLYLGRENRFDIDHLYLGNTEKSSGTLRFAAGLENAELSIQGKGSDEVTRTRANLTVGPTAATSTVSTESVADLTGGRVDAYLDRLNIAVGGQGGSSGLKKGVLKMDEGVIDALTVTVGNRESGATQPSVEARLEMAGGELLAQTLVLGEKKINGVLSASMELTGGSRVEIGSGGLFLGKASGTESARANITATLSIGVGAGLSVEADIASDGTRGTSASTLTLEGGVLDLNGHAIVALDDANPITFNARSGTLRNLGELNSGEDLHKTTAGVLVLEGEHRYTGATRVDEGTLRLSGSLTQANITVAGGAAFELASDGTLQFNITETSGDLLTLEAGAGAVFEGNFRFNLAEGVGEGEWTLLSGTATVDLSNLESVAVSGALSGTLAHLGGEQWRGVLGGNVVEFDGLTGRFVVASIPEPSTWLLLGLGAGLLFVRQRGRSVQG